MTKTVRVPLCLLSGILCWLSLPVSSRATTLSVNCNGSAGEEQLTTIGGALRLLNSEGPNTLNVSGNCHENVVIQSFGRLTLKAVNGASINDASGGTGIVVDIEDSGDVALQGFTINGGDIGVMCGDFSVCRLKNNTIQDATDAVSGDGIGVSVGRSRATFDGDLMKFNAVRGLSAANGATVRVVNVTINNNAIGVFIGGGSVVVADPANIHNNVIGVHVATHSTFNMLAGTITGNTRSGVGLESASEAVFGSFDGPITISSNGGNGVQINDLSFALFTNGGPLLNVTGNGAAHDVQCNPQFSATRGVFTDTNGARTNCIEP
jgi:hypothetical protein